MARTKAFDESEVLDKALQVFWHKGYSATSAQDLVDGLGINRSSLYDTFGDKRTLFIKSLRYYQENYTHALSAMAAQSEDPLKTIRQIFQALVKEGLSTELAKGCFVVNTATELAPHDDEIASIVSENMIEAENAFYTLIKKGQRNGQIAAGLDARAIARFLFNNVTGLRVAIRAGKDKKTLDDITRITLSIFE